MDPEVVAHDKLIAGKIGYLNVPFFLVRAVFFLLGWSTYSVFFSKIFFGSRSFREYFKSQEKLQNISSFSGILYLFRICYVLGLDHVNRPPLV